MVHSVIAQVVLKEGFRNEECDNLDLFARCFFLTTCEGAYKLLNCLIPISLL